MSGREFAGRLRERVVVEALTGERNALGAQMPEYEVVARCLAAVAPEGVGAEAEGQALSAMARFRVTIRVRDSRCRGAVGGGGGFSGAAVAAGLTPSPSLHGRGVI